MPSSLLRIDCSGLSVGRVGVDHVSQVSSLLSLTAGVRLSGSNLGEAFSASLDDSLHCGRVWWEASWSGMILVPGIELCSIEPGDVTDSTGTDFPSSGVYGFPSRARLPRQNLVPVHKNRPRSSKLSIEIFDEGRNYLPTGTTN